MGQQSRRHDIGQHSRLRWGEKRMCTPMQEDQGVNPKGIKFRGFKGHCQSEKGEGIKERCAHQNPLPWNPIDHKPREEKEDKDR